MDLNPSADQKAILAEIDAFLVAESARGWGVDGDADGARSIGDALWRQLAELGWLGLGLPEEDGGVGLGLPDEVLLFREIGRYLLPGPVLGTVVAAHALARSGDDDAAALVAGERRAGWGYGAFAIDAHPGDLVTRIDGDAILVEEVVAAGQVASIDPSLRVFRTTETVPVARVEAGDLAVRARLLIAAELLGIAEAVRDQSAEYAKTREQFGKPIGVNQAVKHRCADQVIRCWAARAQLFLSALLVQEQRPEAELDAASAVVLALEAAQLNVAANVHIHGGIGVTAEHSAGRFVKRSHVLEKSLGDLTPVTEALLTVDGIRPEVTA